MRLYLHRQASPRCRTRRIAARRLGEQRWYALRGAWKAGAVAREGERLAKKTATPRRDVSGLKFALAERSRPKSTVSGFLMTQATRLARQERAQFCGKVK